MEPWMLAKAKQKEKCIVLEKGVTYRTIKRHRTDLQIHVIDSFDAVKEFLAELFEQSPIEVLYAIALNSSNQFLGFIKLSQGTVDRASVHPRELMSFLLIETNATALILAHNHPGGKAEASREDIELSRRIQQQLQILGVRLLDHVIYSPSRLGMPGEWLSMKQENLL